MKRTRRTTRRTTQKELETLVKYLNEKHGYNPEPYTRTEDGWEPSPGTYVLNQAYGKNGLDQLGNEPGATWTTHIIHLTTMADLADQIRILLNA